MQITEALQSLGLNDKEARVYVALLQLGRGSAYAVADRAGLKKPTTYVVLGELAKRGLVSRVPRQRKQLFVAKPPDEFFALAEERLSVAKKTLPELMAIVEGKTPKVRTLYYEGLSGLRDALRYRMKEIQGKEIVGFYATTENASPELIEVFDEYNGELKKHGTKVRGIVPEHASLAPWRETDAAYGRTMKVVPYEAYSAKNSIDVGDTFVRILSFGELQGVVVENPSVAQAMRQIFEMLWQARPEKTEGMVKGE
ncbi:hypothetical protein HYW68_00640 [Candidatus Parcubacteria bacterium]|nr:hypothetical protein [Candidatus Parcubacteria bacterium]